MPELDRCCGGSPSRTSGSLAVAGPQLGKRTPTGERVAGPEAPDPCLEPDRSHLRSRNARGESAASRADRAEVRVGDGSIPARVRSPEKARPML